MARFSLLLMALLMSNATVAQTSGNDTYCGTSFTGIVPPPSQSFSRGGIVEVPVFFHVILPDLGSQGTVTDTQINEQIDILNATFESPDTFFYYEYVFKLIGISRTRNGSWFSDIEATMGDPGPEEDAMKAALHVDPARVVNIYTVDLPPNSAGFAYLPMQYGESDYRGGIVADYRFLPGGGGTIPDWGGPLDLGDLIVHEMGHYLGLLHTFGDSDCKGKSGSSTCSTAGDLVCDTPAHKNLDELQGDCPTPMEAASAVCLGQPAGLDFFPKNNFMSYAGDTCRNTFTNEQRMLMDERVTTHRSTLVSASDDDIYFTDDYLIGPNTTWSLLDVTAYFALGTALLVEGDLDADGTTFTASNAAQGWSGVRFEPGSGGTVKNSVITGVQSYGGASVHITDASPTFQDTRVSDDLGLGAAGFRITGSAASPTLDNNLIQNLSGDGIVLTGGADVRLIENTIQTNGGDGFIASGTGTEAFLSPPASSSPDNGEFGNVIDSNNGHGVYATSSAYLTFGYYYYPRYWHHADGFNSVTENGDRGLYTRYNGRIAAGNTSNQQRNRIFNNTTRDAEAVGTGSRVYASCDWWNDTSPPSARPSPAAESWTTRTTSSPTPTSIPTRRAWGAARAPVRAQRRRRAPVRLLPTRPPPASGATRRAGFSSRRRR